MGPQAITFGEILAYCVLYDIDGVERTTLSRTMVDMDSVWLTWANKQTG